MEMASSKMLYCLVSTATGMPYGAFSPRATLYTPKDVQKCQCLLLLESIHARKYGDAEGYYRHRTRRRATQYTLSHVVEDYSNALLAWLSPCPQMVGLHYDATAAIGQIYRTCTLSVDAVDTGPVSRNHPVHHGGVVEFGRNMPTGSLQQQCDYIDGDTIKPSLMLPTRPTHENERQ